MFPFYSNDSIIFIKSLGLIYSYVINAYIYSIQMDYIILNEILNQFLFYCIILLPFHHYNLIRTTFIFLLLTNCDIHAAGCGNLHKLVLSY